MTISATFSMTMPTTKAGRRRPDHATRHKPPGEGDGSAVRGRRARGDRHARDCAGPGCRPIDPQVTFCETVSALFTDRFRRLRGYRGCHARTRSRAPKRRRLARPAAGPDQGPDSEESGPIRPACSSGRQRGVGSPAQTLKRNIDPRPATCKDAGPRHMIQRISSAAANTPTHIPRGPFPQAGPAAITSIGCREAGRAAGPAGPGVHGVDLGSADLQRVPLDKEPA